MPQVRDQIDEQVGQRHHPQQKGNQQAGYPQPFLCDGDYVSCPCEGSRQGEQHEKADLVFSAVLTVFHNVS